MIEYLQGLEAVYMSIGALCIGGGILLCLLLAWAEKVEQK